MIINHGPITIPASISEYAETIKFDNYKVNTPAKFRTNTYNDLSSQIMIRELSWVIHVPYFLLDFVFFSVCNGAEPHTDLLDQNIFEDTTYVIPIILPKGKSVITAEDTEERVSVGYVYEFDHTKMHSMELQDTHSGCVVLMVAVKKIEHLGVDFEKVLTDNLWELYES